MKLHNLFLLLSFTLLFVSNIFGQAAVDIPLSLTDGTLTIPMAVGLDLTATNCIDPQLGESDLPPIPPVAIFECRFDLAPYGCGPVSSYKDYRAPGNPPEFPFTGLIEHTLWWQTYSPASPIDITYNLPPGAIMRITDQINGSFLNLGPFTGQGTATIPGSYMAIFAKAFLKMQYNNIGGDPTTDPVFSLLPNSLNFGQIALGETMTLPVWISNVGFLDSLYICNAVSSNPSFTFEPNSFPLVLAPGETQMFEITYTGITGGTHIDSILFFHNASGSPGCLNVQAQTFEPNQNCGAQMFWDVVVADGVDPFVRHLVFGLDSTATDDIDPQLGENGPLPPFPPPGAFEAQLFLPENNFSGTLSSYCDFRYAVLPFTGQKEWRLAYQPGLGTTITITWDFPSNVTGVLQDIINGTFINVPMIDSGSYTVQDPYVFNRLRMLIDFDIEVPVELITFNAKVNDKTVQLEWVTVTETNNKRFEIERARLRSSNYAEASWETIGFVPGFGTTTEPKSYSFTDEDVTTGIYKYRLKQIDFDGSFTYSNEIEVSVDFTPKEYVLYQNYPNPFNPSTTIKYALPVESQVRINIYNALGEVIEELVSKMQSSGNYEVTWNAQNYSSGIYYYSFEVNSADGSQSHREMKKIVFLK